MLKGLIDEIQIILIVFGYVVIVRYYKVETLFFTLKYNKGLGAGLTNLSIPTPWSIILTITSLLFQTRVTLKKK